MGGSYHKRKGCKIYEPELLSKECISGYQGLIDLGQIVEPPGEGGRVPKRNYFYNDLSSPPEWLASPWDGE